MEISKEFDALEESIEKQCISHEKLIGIYKNFLLELIFDDEFYFIEKTELEYFAICLKKSESLLFSKQESEREKVRLELWDLADRKQKTNPIIYNFARCVILVYGKIDQLDNAPDPFIFYCLLFLRKILPNIESKFIEYFKKNLFSNGS